MPVTIKTGLWACVLLYTLACQANDARTIETLLKELRELRTAVQTEKRQTQTELRHNKHLLEQSQAQLAKLDRDLKDSRAQRDQVRTELASSSSRMKALREQSNAYRELLRKQIEQLKLLLRQYPLLASEELTKQLDALATSNSPIDQLGAQFWNTSLNLALRTVEVEVIDRKVKVGSKEFHAQVLRVGALTAAWLTPNGRRGGYCRSQNGQLLWEELGKTELKAIRHAFKVAKREQTAELVLLPVQLETKP